MQLRDIFLISKGTKVILVITLTVSALAIIFAVFYYRAINRSADPRTRRAIELLAEYDNTAGSLSDINTLHLLDSALAIFNSVSGYGSSFEIGIIYNNKCSALLIKAIYDTTIRKEEKEALLDLSMKYCDSSISVYTNWIRDWKNASPEEIAERISPAMKEDESAFEGLNIKRIFNRRVKNIQEAQIEMPRRLSVSLSNKAAIYRHFNKPDSSFYYYREALSLWEDNRTAKSNLNVLMGGEPIKPRLIESLFPPERIGK